jgi:hypothetical protein
VKREKWKKAFNCRILMISEVSCRLKRRRGWRGKRGDKAERILQKNNANISCFLGIIWQNFEKKHLSRRGIRAKLCRFYGYFLWMQQKAQIP